jgi:hypothetical protein
MYSSRSGPEPYFCAWNVSKASIAEVFGFAQGRSADLLTDDGPARNWLGDARDFHLTASNKSGPGFLRGPTVYGARGTSARAAIKFYIVTTIAPVKPPAAAVG